MKKFITMLLLSLSLLTGVMSLQALAIQAVPPDEELMLDDSFEQKASSPVLIEVFTRDECQHCQDEKVFLTSLESTRDDIQITYYDISDPKNRQLFDEVTKLSGISKSTPITLIGDTVISGFNTPETTGQTFKILIDQAEEQGVFSFEEFVSKGGSTLLEETGSTCDEGSTECVVNDLPFFVKIPFVGNVDVKEYSLPVMSGILGFIDGFNPCAMWVLVTFLLVLVQIGDKKRMFQIAGIFILAEAIMYYMILTFWASAWDWVGLDNIVTPIIGIVAIGGGLFFLWEWYSLDGTCKVTNMEQRAKTKSKVDKLAAAEMTIATILGILGLALSVNIIEFACSIGIPQAFTKILDLNGLSFLGKQFYTLIYIIFYMADDFIVFGIALYSIQKIGMVQKYSKWCNLAGGVLMLAIGAIMILKPELLVF